MPICVFGGLYTEESKGVGNLELVQWMCEKREGFVKLVRLKLPDL